MPAEGQASGVLQRLPRCWRKGGVPTGNIFDAACHGVTAALPPTYAGGDCPLGPAARGRPGRESGR